jgi:two-component system chemotaxis response regulator CheB
VTRARNARRSGTQQVRAVVVDDSQFMRTVIGDILEADGIEVVATASDGAAAVEAVLEHSPDVVTMDLERPGLGGIEAVERLMAERPTPVLVLSAHAGSDTAPTFEALEKGAIDFFTKPGGEVSMEMRAHEDQLVETVRSVAAADPTAAGAGGATAGGTGTAGTGAGAETVTRSPTTTTREDGPKFRDGGTLVVGASTGGPPVVERLLAGLPLDADLRVLVIQHMPDGFTDRFADRLDAASDYDVREATDGARIGGGEALVAKGNHHLVVSGYGGGRLRVRLTEDEPVHGVRPAADRTLESAAAQVDGPLTAAILTGMGHDGATGVESVADAGGTVVAQDEASSAVFGMPRRAIETGVVDEVHPGSDLAGAISRSFTES